MNQNAGKCILLLGGIVVLIGIVVYFFGQKLNWIGRLPGDIRIQRENFRFYFPVTTFLLFSLLLTLVISIIKRFL